VLGDAVDPERVFPLRPSAAARMRSISPPGSMTAARRPCRHQTSEQFCWNSVTGMMTQ
jgi:hypothetical protein